MTHALLAVRARHEEDAVEQGFRSKWLALRHYEMGTAIGALSLGQDLDGVLPWGLIDNRPLLRCLHGTGLCAWRLGDMQMAKAVFTKMLWLNPTDCKVGFGFECDSRPSLGDRYCV